VALPASASRLDYLPLCNPEVPRLHLDAPYHLWSIVSSASEPLNLPLFNLSSNHHAKRSRQAKREVTTAPLAQPWKASLVGSL